MVYRDQQFARRYRECRPLYTETLFDRLIDLLPARDLAWDCGTGNGQAAVSLASRFTKVQATDPSLEQLGNAYTEHANIEYVHTSEGESGLASESVDLVTAAQSVHWFDLAKFYTEVNRVLKPGGRVAVWSYAQPRVDDSIDAILHRIWLAAPRPHPIVHVERKYKHLLFPFHEPLAFEVPNEVFWPASTFVEYALTLAWIPDALKLDDRGAIREGLDDIERLWGTSKRSVSWTLAVRVGQKRA